MNLNEFINEVKKLNISLTDNQIIKLNKYKDYLIEYNKHTNLTRIINDNDIYLKHFYDSLTIIKYVNLNNINNILDIGTGAGFPGMVLKIVFPNINVTLLDSNNKKITFLKELSNLLDIDIELVCDRAEKFINNRREYYDMVISRAVANLSVLLELTIPFVKINGLFISMKANAEDEIKNAENVPKLLGAELVSINKFKLIKENSNRTIIIYKKITKTNIKYPRLYDKIKNNPLV